MYVSHLDSSETATENLIPCWMTHISFGATCMRPNSVLISSVPCWGTARRKKWAFFTCEFHSKDQKFNSKFFDTNQLENHHHCYKMHNRSSIDYTNRYESQCHVDFSVHQPHKPYVNLPQSYTFSSYHSIQMVSIAFDSGLDADRPNYSRRTERQKIVGMVRAKRMDVYDRTMYVDCCDVAQWTLCQIIVQHTNHMHTFGDYFDSLAMHSDSLGVRIRNANQIHSCTELKLKGEKDCR